MTRGFKCHMRGSKNTHLYLGICTQITLENKMFFLSTNKRAIPQKAPSWWCLRGTDTSARLLSWPSLAWLPATVVYQLKSERLAANDRMYIQNKSDFFNGRLCLETSCPVQAAKPADMAQLIVGTGGSPPHGTQVLSGLCTRLEPK